LRRRNSDNFSATRGLRAWRQVQPGRALQSLEPSSFDAWIRHERRR